MSNNKGTGCITLFYIIAVLFLLTGIENIPVVGNLLVLLAFVALAYGVVTSFKKDK